MFNNDRHTILCVDDEVNILNALKRLLRREGYNFLSAGSAVEALDLLKENEVQVVVSDQRMPKMNGTELMACIKDLYPDILRIILTGYTDVDSIAESINKGHVYKFFLKPWNDQNLKLEIKQAFEQYELILANKRLDQTVIEQNKALRRINENLENIVEERTREIALQNQALALSHAILEDVPVSILGVDENGIIVLANKMARTRIGGNGVNVGAHLENYFPEQVSAAAEKVFAHGKACTVELSVDGEKDPRSIQISPIVGAYGGKGIILTL